MVTATVLQTAEIEDLARRALIAAGARESNARSLASAIAAAERDGVASHGLAYLPTYCEHIGCGKVDGGATPELQHVKPGLLAVDAKTGFAHPAIDLGLVALIPLAREQGIAALAIRNSYNCGVLGYHTERLAQSGLVGLGFNRPERQRRREERDHAPQSRGQADSRGVGARPRWPNDDGSRNCPQRYDGAERRL